MCLTLMFISFNVRIKNDRSELAKKSWKMFKFSRISYLPLITMELDFTSNVYHDQSKYKPLANALHTRIAILKFFL